MTSPLLTYAWRIGLLLTLAGMTAPAFAGGGPSDSENPGGPGNNGGCCWIERSVRDTRGRVDIGYVTNSLWETANGARWAANEARRDTGREYWVHSGYHADGTFGYVVDDQGYSGDDDGQRSSSGRGGRGTDTDRGCPVLSLPLCVNGTLESLGKDGQGCSKGAKCLPYDPPTISADKAIVRFGDPVTIAWKPGQNTGCRLSDNLASLPARPDGTVAGSSEHNPTGETTYTIRCDGNGTATASVIVKMLPKIQET